MTTSNEANLTTVRELFKTKEHITAWEVNFLGSIEGQMKRGSILTAKQQAVLDKMARKVSDILEDQDDDIDLSGDAYRNN